MQCTRKLIFFLARQAKTNCLTRHSPNNATELTHRLRLVRLAREARAQSLRAKGAQRVPTHVEQVRAQVAVEEANDERVRGELRGGGEQGRR